MTKTLLMWGAVIVVGYLVYRNFGAIKSKLGV